MKQEEKLAREQTQEQKIYRRALKKQIQQGILKEMCADFNAFGLTSKQDRAIMLRAVVVKTRRKLRAIPEDIKVRES